MDHEAGVKNAFPITCPISCCREHLGTGRAHRCMWSVHNAPVCSGGWDRAVLVARLDLAANSQTCWVSGLRFG